MKKRLLEIKARKAEILAELKDADETRVAELNAEVESLTAEETQIRSKLDLAGKLGTPEEKPQEKKAKPNSAVRLCWRSAPSPSAARELFFPSIRLPTSNPPSTKFLRW